MLIFIGIASRKWGEYWTMCKQCQCYIAITNSDKLSCQYTHGSAFKVHKNKWKLQVQCFSKRHFILYETLCIAFKINNYYVTLCTLHIMLKCWILWFYTVHECRLQSLFSPEPEFVNLLKLSGHAQEWEFWSQVFYIKWTHLGRWLRDWSQKNIFLSLGTLLRWFLVFYRMLSVWWNFFLVKLDQN